MTKPYTDLFFNSSGYIVPFRSIDYIIFGSSGTVSPVQSARINLIKGCTVRLEVEKIKNQLEGYYRYLNSHKGEK